MSCCWEPVSEHQQVSRTPSWLSAWPRILLRYRCETGRCTWAVFNIWHAGVGSEARVIVATQIWQGASCVPMLCHEAQRQHDMDSGLQAGAGFDSLVDQGYVASQRWHRGKVAWLPPTDTQHSTLCIIHAAQHTAHSTQHIKPVRPCALTPSAPPPARLGSSPAPSCFLQNAGAAPMQGPSRLPTGMREARPSPP